MLSASILGLVLAFSSVVYAGDIDAGTAIAQDASLTASGTPTDIAPTEAAPAAGAPETAPEEVKTDSAAVVSEVEPSNPAEEAPADTADEVYQALKAGKWLVAFGGVLMFLIWGIRAFLAWREVEWFEGDLGGNVLAFGTSFGLAIATALLAGQPLSLGLFTAAAGAAWGAKGIWSHRQAAKKAKLAKEG